MTPTTPEPWNLTEAQRRQFREAHAEAKRTPKPQPLAVACPRCGVGAGEACISSTGQVTTPHEKRKEQSLLLRKSETPPET